MGKLKNKIEEIGRVRSLVGKMNIGDEIKFKKVELNSYSSAQVYWTKTSEKRYHIEPGKPWKSTMIKRIE